MLPLASIIYPQIPESISTWIVPAFPSYIPMLTVLTVVIWGLPIDGGTSKDQIIHIFIGFSLMNLINHPFIRVIPKLWSFPRSQGRKQALGSPAVAQIASATLAISYIARWVVGSTGAFQVVSWCINPLTSINYIHLINLNYTYSIWRFPARHGGWAPVIILIFQYFPGNPVIASSYLVVPPWLWKPSIHSLLPHQHWWSLEWCPGPGLHSRAAPMGSNRIAPPFTSKSTSKRSDQWPCNRKRLIGATYQI